MRFATLILSSASVLLCGCYTQTNITRTVKHANGSTEIYENKSNGYNYNPNFTGTAEQSVHIRDYGYGYGGYGMYGGMGYGGMMGVGGPVAPVVPVPVVVPNYGQYGYPY
jgi:hypothetical protein